MPILVSALFGLCFGSFASVVIHRLRTGKGSIVYSRSRCPKCRHALGPVDLIPVISFLSTGGKCLHCGKPIAWTYPALELAMAATFAITTAWAGIGNPGHLVYYLFLTFIFVTISFYDILYREIPDSLSLPTIVLSGFLGWFWHLHTLKDLGVGLLVPVAFFGSLVLFSRGRWLGAGDIRVGAIMGFVLGWPTILVGLFLAYTIGSLVSLIAILAGKLSLKSAIAFGPFLFLGTYISMIWGDKILSWYLGLI
jgi:prepilin signal peptidase PulO-like enzyme (type II secretory pathway)